MAITAEQFKNMTREQLNQHLQNTWSGVSAPATAGSNTSSLTPGVSNVPTGVSAPVAVGGGRSSSSSGSSSSRSSYSAPSYSAPSNLNMAAANDIVYWKQMYDQALNAGKPKESLNWIAQQAQKSYGQLDPETAKQLQGMNAAQAAAWYRAAKDANNSDTNQTAFTPNVATGTGIDPVENQGPSEYDQLMEMLMGYLQGYDQQLAAYQQQQQAYQQQLAEMQRQQLGSLLGQYRSAQDADLQALDNAYAAQKSQLEDDTFQQWLQARQEMANRGLAGSGLASDQDTRLLMANNKNLTSLFNNINDQKNQIKLRYGSQIDNINNQLAALNSYLPSFPGVGSTTPATASAANVNNALSAYAPAAPNDTTLNMMFKIFETVLPYTRATVKDQMNYAIDVDEQKRKWAETRGYDETGNPTLDYLKYMLDVDKASDASAQAWAKIYGVDSQGNPTFDARKWMAEFDLDKWYKQQSVDQGWADVNIRQYKAQQDVAQGWAQVQIQQQNANTRIAELKQREAEFKTKQEKDDFKAQVSAATTLMNSAYKAMNDAQARMSKSLAAGKPVDENDFETYQRAKKQYDIAYAAIDGLAQTGINQGAGLVKPSVDTSSLSFNPLDQLFNVTKNLTTNPKSSAPTKYESEISKAVSTYNNVPSSLVKAVIQAESSFNPNAKSSAGAAGLMQLMPATAKSLGVKNVYDPAQNIMGGTKYLSQMISKYGDTSLALAAYNWGPGNVDKAIKKYGKSWSKIAPHAPKETQNYVKKVLSNMK